MIQKIFLVSFVCLMTIEIWFDEWIPAEHAVAVHVFSSLALILILLSKRTAEHELKKQKFIEGVLNS